MIGSWISRTRSWFEELFYASSKSTVTPWSAVQFPAIWYAINRISGHVGQLPMVLQEEDDDEGVVLPAKTKPAYKLMMVRPNSWQTPFIFKQLMQTHVLLWGNAYAYIHRIGNRPAELVPLYPGLTEAKFVGGEKRYLHCSTSSDDPIRRYLPRNRVNADGLIDFGDSDILHLPGLGFDGLAGLPIWKIASQSWGISLASDKRIQQGFENGFKSAMLLEAPPGVLKKEEEAREFLDGFNNRHVGADNADRVGLLRHGIKANVVQLSSQEAQMVEHRMHQRQDAALWFLLEQILGDDSSVSYNSLEQKNLAYLSNCLMRWLKLWEEEATVKLLQDREMASGRYAFKFATTDLIRADIQTTMTTLSTGITSRIYSPNEARKKLGLNPYEGGDTYENPAVSPGTPGSEEDPPSEPEDDSEDDMEELDESQAALRSRIAHMIGIEAQRMVQRTNAAKYPDFLGAVDGFQTGFAPTLAKAIAESGGDPSLVDGYLEQSKIRMEQAADLCTSHDELRHYVEGTVKNWKTERVDELMAEGAIS